MSKTRRALLKPGLPLIAVVWSAAAAPAAEPPDWVRWRGPEGNGISTETNWNPQALAAPTARRWQVRLGQGYSAVSVQGSNLFTMGNVNERDIVYCLDADTGREIWRHEYPCPKGSYPGPRATPTLDGDRVYTLTREGDVFCLNAKTGAVLWRKNVLKGSGAKAPQWGLASSPLIWEQAVVLNVGRRGAALDKTTGRKLWDSDGVGGYAAPVPYPLPRGTGLALFSSKEVLGVNAADGRELWAFPWETSYDVNAADPLVQDGRVFVSSGYGRGCALLDVSGAQVRPLWENKALRSHFSSAVLIDGHLYGIDGNAGRGALRCLAWTSGELQWSSDLGFGSLLAAGGRLIVLNEKGSLFVVAAKPAACEELARAEGAVPLEKGERCWTMPVLCRGRLYCRTSGGTLVCFDLRP